MNPPFDGPCTAKRTIEPYEVRNSHTSRAHAGVARTLLRPVAQDREDQHFEHHNDDRFGPLASREFPFLTVIVVFAREP